MYIDQYPKIPFRCKSRERERERKKPTRQTSEKKVQMNDKRMIKLLRTRKREREKDYVHEISTNKRIE